MLSFYLFFYLHKEYDSSNLFATSEYQYMATLNFVCNGTNKFTKQVDQSLMNFYLIDGFSYLLQICMPHI